MDSCFWYRFSIGAYWDVRRLEGGWEGEGGREREWRGGGWSGGRSVEGGSGGAEKGGMMEKGGGKAKERREKGGMRRG
jgi:hypothetical protein